MKNLKILITFIMAAVMFGCSEDDNSLDVLDNVGAPTNVSALFTITQDNTGVVKIWPKGEGVVNFDVHFGHGDAEPVTLTPGNFAQHTYPEGTFDVTIVARAINGKTTEVVLPLTVSFLPPANLDTTVLPVTGNSLAVTVKAVADLETFFTVDWGDGTEPQQFMEGDELVHQYENVGTYTVTVTAYSGGSGTVSESVTVTVTDPLVLPVTFESTTQNYAFTDFNGNASAVVDNPDPSGINTSSKVGKMTPAAGQVWTGGFLTFGEPLNLTTHKFFKMKVWSPAAGVTVKLKLENLTDGNIFHEVDAVTTVANQWEELTYDFTAATGQYSKMVIFFNAGNPGTGDTYYFDDIENYNGGEPIGFPLTFEGNAVYAWNNFGGAIGNEVENPHVEGINTSARVGQFSKFPPQPWAGVAIPFDAPIDFSSQQKVKIKVWSPVAGIPIVMKFEDMNPHNEGNDIQRTMNTSVANQWEEITFDFTGINNANEYQQIVLFFNFDTVGAGEIYYFDDIQLSN